MTVDSRRGVRAAGTRSELLTVARRLFAERGFAGTSTEEVVLQAGVTRGALYYHFRNKEDLFRAVFGAVQEDVVAQVSAVAMAEAQPWDGVVAACAAYLDASLDPATQRIALLDAPSVLGWEEWREIGFQDLFGLLAAALSWAITAGELADRPVVPLIHVLLGALHEGAMFIARADDPAATRNQVGAVLSELLKGLQLR